MFESDVCGLNDAEDEVEKTRKSQTCCAALRYCLDMPGLKSSKLSLYKVALHVFIDAHRPCIGE